MRDKIISCVGMLPVLLYNFASVFAADQKSVTGTLTNDVSYVVTNNKEAIIPTGISMNIVPVIVVGILALSVFVISKRRAVS